MQKIFNLLLRAAERCAAGEDLRSMLTCLLIVAVVVDQQGY
jgi:hypothetical protein